MPKLTAGEIKTFITSVFDEVAECYDINPFFNISANYLIEFIKTDGDGRLLDISTGTGIIAIIAAKKYPGLKIDGIDLSSKMLNQARDKAGKLKLDNIKFYVKDAEKLEYSDEEFDIITCGYGLFFYPDIDNALKYIYRILKPGGQFIFSTFTEKAFTPYTEMFIDLLTEYGIKRPTISRTRLETTDQIKDLCNSVGINEVTVNLKPIRYNITIEDWWNILSYAGYKGLINQIAPDDLPDFKHRHLDQVSVLSKNGEIPLIADSLYGIVTK